MLFTQNASGRSARGSAADAGLPPLAPGALPVLGHLEKLLRDPLTWLRSCSGAAPIVRVEIARHRLFLVCDADLVQEMLINKEGAFDKGGPFFEAARQLAPNSLVTCPARQHRRQRTLMQPAFSPRSVAEAEAVMAEAGERAARTWQDGQELDVVAETGRMAHGVVTRALMTSVTGAIDVDHLRGVLNDLTRAGVLQVVVPASLRRLVPSVDRRYAAVVEAIHRAAGDILDAARGQGSEGLLGTLVAGSGGAERQLSEEELRDQIITLLIAGTETTASTLAWALHVLAVRPDLQERLHDELDRLPPGPISPKNRLSDLPFTLNLISETLRRYPSNWLLSRSTVRPTTLGGHRFVAGAALLFSPYQVHHDPRNFDDPLRFDPDRWDGRLSSTSRRGYLPFGAGARGCIGDRFAVSEIVNLLVAITRRWYLVPVPGGRIRDKRPQVFAVPHGLRLRVVARSSRGAVRPTAA